MATVKLAACKIANILFGLAAWQTILVCGVLNVVFAAHSGLWGVLVIDMIQFFIKMTAVIAAAYFAVTQPQVGGLERPGGQAVARSRGPGGLELPEHAARLHQQLGPGAGDLHHADRHAWWANWYPGAEPGGGSYIAQRMLASKSEKDSLGGTLFFNLAHYVLRPWPWIIVGALRR